MKKIVTHTNPDTDAIASVWLIKRFLPGWEKAAIDFATAKEAVKLVKKNDPEVIITDVGLGALDHHQSRKISSATKKCWGYIKKKRAKLSLSPLEGKAIERIVDLETEVDNARDLGWPEVSQDRYQLYFHVLIDGLKKIQISDSGVMEFGLAMLDTLFANFKSKIRAEEELRSGREFATPWGKGIALLTGNTDVLWLAEALGYSLAIKKDPETGGMRINARWDRGVDLTRVYEKLRELDPDSDWFLHSSKVLLLNQASVAPNMRPTKLSLEEIIKIFEDL